MFCLVTHAEAPPPEPASEPADPIAARLQTLATLLERGLISEDDYRRTRQQVLDRL